MLWGNRMLPPVGLQIKALPFSFLFFFFSAVMYADLSVCFRWRLNRREIQKTTCGEVFSKRHLHHLPRDFVNFDSVCVALVSCLSTQSDCVVTVSEWRPDPTKYGGFCTNTTQTRKVTTTLVADTTVCALNLKSEVGAFIPFDAEKNAKRILGELRASLWCLFNAAKPCGLCCSPRIRNLSSLAVFSSLRLCARFRLCVKHMVKCVHHCLVCSHILGVVRSACFPHVFVNSSV